MTVRKWLNCRLRDLHDKLLAIGHQVSLPVISRLLKAQDYRLRVNRKSLESATHPDRNQQFDYIHEERT